MKHMKMIGVALVLLVVILIVTYASLTLMSLVVLNGS